eukprot:TRINITY_DN59276_c0_g1_i1.p1 TRINITY_DN59276_c0_g1~~TRINITY_DN59276_c0_g1_i1.p1  ORF type:complete len:106 (+),score=60.71 TRINITY_DN59276_c0_g1_i1:79-396(+)
MSLASKLQGLQEVHFPDLTRKQAEQVVTVLGKTSDEEKIKEQVKELSSREVDTLMKVLYRALETGKSSSVLFRWHAVVAEIGGTGSIIRTLMDKTPEEEPDSDED